MLYNPKKSKKKMTIKIVLASSYPKGAIGQNNELPWAILEDLAYFRRLTTRVQSAVIMGRRTWESIGSKPLPHRKNIIVSESLSQLSDQKAVGSTDVVFVRSLGRALNYTDDLDVFVIGGARLFAEAVKMSSPTIYHTEIYSNYPGADTFWKIPDHYTIWHSGQVEVAMDVKNNKQISYRHVEWIRKDYIVGMSGMNVNPEEMQYLKLLQRILSEGEMSSDRTGTGTRSIMGGHFRFNLRTGFPAITTKPLFWKGVVEELLWLMSGDTNAKHLASLGVHIWDKDTSREKLDERGRSHLAEGDCGATYGFNMRHFGAEYKGCLEDYTGLGEDQLAKCVDTLMKNPTDRRIIINLWDPSSLNNCALPPCLMMYVFYVSRGELSCFTVQRSADMMLGVPFNIASSSLLTHILANMAGLKVGDVDHNMVNAHVYLNHMDAAREQLARDPFPKPMLKMPTDDSGETKKITLADFGRAFPRTLGWCDFSLLGYRNYPKLKNPTVMAA